MKRYTAKNAPGRAFTLLELMIVLGIIAILLGLTLPAFLKLSKSNAVDVAARMVASQLRLARAEAIARRQFVAVIMPGRDLIRGSDNSEDNPVIYRYQSFRAAVVTKDGENDYYIFSEWIAGTKWTFLPVGAVIAEADGDYDALTSDDPPEPKGDSWNIGDDDHTLQKVSDSTSPNIRIFAGVSNTNVRAVIFKPNGRCVQKIYVTIMEGVNATPEPTSQEELEAESEFEFQGYNKNNIRVLEISPFTGKIRFLF